MRINKEAKSFGMSWENEYGYSQAIKVDNTIYVSGQVSHDERGNIVGPGNTDVQMRQAYANIEKVLAQYGATIDNIVDELLFVTDMDAAFAARAKCKQEVFTGNPVLASTIVQIPRLAFPELMVEIRCICSVRKAEGEERNYREERVYHYLRNVKPNNVSNILFCRYCFCFSSLEEALYR